MAVRTQPLASIIDRLAALLKSLVLRINPCLMTEEGGSIVAMACMENNRVQSMHPPPANPLHELWLTVAAAHADEMAVLNLADGREWTFAGLRALAEQAPPSPPVLHTTARGLNLLIDVLRTWRDGAVLVPDDGSGTAAPPRDTFGRDICHLKVTSGTTGRPRHVMFRPEQLAADAVQIVTTMGLRKDWPNLGVLSMAHSYGFSNLVLPLLLHAVPLWLLDNPLPETLRLAMRAGQPLTLPAVPAMWQAWERVGLDFTPVRLAISAGAPLPIALESAVYARSSLKIHNFYGSSECGGIAYDRTEEPRQQATLAGTPMDRVSVTIDTASGCLRVTSAAVAAGYWNADPSSIITIRKTKRQTGGESDTGFPACEPAQTQAGKPVSHSNASRDRNDWGAASSGVADGPGHGTWLSQDLARIDDECCVHVLGRASDFISVAGHKISPVVIEEILHALPGVSRCVVFGVPSPNAIRVEDLVACVELDPGTELNTLKAALGHLPSTYQPRHWWQCDTLAPDARGKISRRSWRDHWLAQQTSRIPG